MRISRFLWKITVADFKINNKQLIHAQSTQESVHRAKRPTKFGNL